MGLFSKLFSNKICSTCKIEKQLIEFYKHKLTADGYRGQCKGCVKQYEIKNADKIKEQKKQYRIKNIDKLNQYAKKHRQNNPDYYKQYRQDNIQFVKQTNKKYYKDNAEVIKQQTKQYRQDNATVVKEKQKQYYIDNIEKSKQYRLDNAEAIKNYCKQYRESKHGKLVMKAISHKRNALIRCNTIGKHWTAQDILLKLKLQHGKCVYCQTSIKEYYEVDHIIPISKGGSNESNNIQLLCKQCNGPSGKWDKLPHEYAQQYGMLV